MSDNADDEQVLSEHQTLSVGAKLKAKREEKSMSLEDVASKTRVTIRHLEAIENSEYSKLPGKTYVIGFTKSYARCVDLNDAEIAAELREELANSDQFINSHHIESYEPASASRIPSKALAWTAAVIGFIALAGLLIWSNAQLNRDDSGPVEANGTIAADEPVENAPAPEAPLPTGKVILTAKGEVWLEVYDFNRETLYENIMNIGDTYEVPADANDPLIVTGRADLIEFTVGDKVIKPLGDGKNTTKNVRISAEALVKYDASTDTEAPQVPSAEINANN